MSKYIQPVIEAFWEGKTRKINNTKAEEFKLYLFENCIAWIDFNENLWIDTCGWKTKTTRDRLQMLNPVFYLKIVKGKWLITTEDRDFTNENTLNWVEWNGGKLNIEKLYYEQHKNRN